MHDDVALDALRREFAGVYARSPELAVRAPGRVDLMGSHTDYNEGSVMTMAIDRDTVVLAASTSRGTVRVRSMNMDQDEELPLPVNGDPRSVVASCRSEWARYVAAVFAAAQESGISPLGADLLVHTNVPIGGGLSSSAALECAVLQAILGLTHTEMDGRDRARLCRRAENEYVGVRCGILDQFSSVMARNGQVVVLDSRDLSFRTVEVPDGLSFVVCDTNAPRSLGTSEYGTRRTECEEAAKILSKRTPGVRTLRDVSPPSLRRHQSALPERARRRARFIVEENARVADLARAFERGDVAAVRSLFLESFAGARDLFEIVVPAMEAMHAAMLGAPGCIGARQAGAGFGGCMIAAVQTASRDVFAESVVSRYRAQTGINADAYLVNPAAGASLLAEDSDREA
jgi:galactokinase